jgi:hypothetical protein
MTLTAPPGMVVLVVSVSGVGQDEWNSLALAAFSVSSSGDLRFPAVLRTAMDLKADAPNWSVGEPRVAFFVPTDLTTFEPRYRRQPPATFTASATVKSALR